MKYAPLGFKSDYSLLKSILKVEDIVDYAKNVEAHYVGILDDNPYGIMDFFDKCEKASRKGVFGMVVKIGDKKIFLYVQNYEGYLNIIKINDLVTENSLTIENLIRYNAGLICVLPYEQYNLFNRLKPAYEVYLAYRNEKELENAIQISKNVVFLSEIRYLKKEDETLLKVVYKIAGCNDSTDGAHVSQASEFDIQTLDRFQEKCNLEFDFGQRHIPHFCKTEEDSCKLLYSLANKGLSKRLEGKVTSEYKQRLDYELSVIKDMGFVDYFLIVYDYVKFAKKNDIYVGPGRGSAAGALVSYTLGITDIDPLKYDLLFERFLNPERVTMPDIDMDFEDIKRNDVIDYVKEKYGEKSVSLIIAYGTFGCRQAIRDVAKIFEYDEETISSISKKLDPKKTLLENVKNADVVSFIKEKKLEKVYKIAMRLEGLKKNTTIHAAGVVISSMPLNELIPTFKSGDQLLSGYTMEYLEKLGLLKMDFLAIRNLTIIHNTVSLIRKKDSSFDLRTIPFDDAKTFKEVFKVANTDNVFQFETPGMKNFLRKLDPENFEDLIAAIALFRPGPMQNIDEYIARRKGQKKVEYLHQDLEPILKSTFGIIIYQEQIMQILVKMGGYTFAEADIIRRAMSKKKKEVMTAEREKFNARAIKKGYKAELANEVYDLILRFADYGFNKSHSVAYAIIAYQMAYLKANYVECFQANNLNMNLGSEKKTKDVIEDAKNKGFKIVRPNINKSAMEYAIVGGEVILPLSSIKNVSSAQSKVIVENAPYEDFFDFCKKTFKKGINRTTMELLIKAGAMDDFGVSKNTLLANIDAANTYIELIESLDESLVMKPELEISSEPDEEYSEIDMFGFYISGHPASKFTDKGIIKAKDLARHTNRRVEAVALVDKVKVINTKKGERMAFVSLNDDTGKMDSVIFPRNNGIINDLVEGQLYRFKATVSSRNGENQLVIESAESLA